MQINQLLGRVVCAIAFFAIDGGAAESAEFWPTKESVGQLCIERFEDNGWLNVVPVTIVVDGNAGARAALESGGQSVCFYLYPGRYRLNLVWRWDERDPHWRSYSSAASDVDVGQNSLTVREVCAGEYSKMNHPVWVVMKREGCERLIQKSNTPAKRN